jgi:hypothetical protein
LVAVPNSEIPYLYGKEHGLWAWILSKRGAFWREGDICIFGE